MKEIQMRMVKLVVDHAVEFGSGVKGDPLNDPNDLVEFLKLSLMDDLDFDSLDTVELTMAFEDALEIDLPDELFENLSPEEYTVAKFIDIAEEQHDKTRVGQL